MFHRSDAFSIEHLKEIVENSSSTRIKAKIFSAHRFKNFRASLDAIFDDLPKITYFKFLREKPGAVMVKKDSNGSYKEDKSSQVRK